MTLHTEQKYPTSGSAYRLETLGDCVIFKKVSIHGQEVGRGTAHTADIRGQFGRIFS